MSRGRRRRRFCGIRGILVAMMVVVMVVVVMMVMFVRWPVLPLVAF